MTQSTIGTVYLNVSSLDRLLPFYVDVIGLHELRREGRTVYLGAGAEALLALSEQAAYRRVPGSTGLYHFAILMPSREALGRSFKRLIDTNTQLQGGSDHGVSEALYLADPEGNGIELYRDRPRSEWYDAQGRFLLTTAPLDTRGVLDSANGMAWSGLHPETIMGHIHLHVAALPETETFYCDLLGLDMMMNMPGMGALFLSYEGYHHHIGANIWAGRTPPPDDALGLDKYVLHLPDAAALDAALTHLDAAQIPVEASAQGHLVQDPSRNRLLLCV